MPYLYFRAALHAARRDDHAGACALIRQAMLNDRACASGWGWLSSILDPYQLEGDFLERALMLSEDSAIPHDGLDRPRLREALDSIPL